MLRGGRTVCGAAGEKGIWGGRAFSREGNMGGEKVGEREPRVERSVQLHENTPKDLYRSLIAKSISMLAYPKTMR
jgi:hypothetical protein